VAEAHTDAFGNYLTGAGVPSGTYFARVYAFGQAIDEVYDGIPCPGDCLANAGTPIVLTAGATQSNINFSLNSGATFTGRVTSSAGAALSDVVVSIYDSTGAFAAGGLTDAYGFYSTSPGLAPGSYFAATYNTQGFVDQLFDSVSCTGGACAPTSGT